MNKTGAKQAGFIRSRAIYAVDGISQPPDLTDILRGSYLAGASNLPHHRSAPFDRRLTIVQQDRGKSQGLFPRFFKVFSRFLGIIRKAGCATSRKNSSVVTLRSGLDAKVLSRSTPQNVRRGRCPLWPFRSAPVLALLQSASPRFFVTGETIPVHVSVRITPQG